MPLEAVTATNLLAGFAEPMLAVRLSRDVVFDWRPACGLPDELETGMLEFACAVGDASRLSCQITVSEDIEGMPVRRPARQY